MQQQKKEKKISAIIISEKSQNFSVPFLANRSYLFFFDNSSKGKVGRYINVNVESVNYKCLEIMLHGSRTSLHTLLLEFNLNNQKLFGGNDHK